MQPDLSQLKKSKLLKIEKKVTVSEGKELPYLEIERKRFDPNTGKAIEPEVQTLNPQTLRQQLEQLKTGKENIETQIANIELLLKEFE